MHDALDPLLLQQSADQRFVGDVALGKLVIGRGLDIAKGQQSAGIGQLVERHNAAALRDEAADNGAADEARTAGDEEALQAWSDSPTPTQRRKVGEERRKSTATSNTRPRVTRTSLPCSAGASW